jgi:cysteine synthase
MSDAPFLEAAHAERVRRRVRDILERHRNSTIGLIGHTGVAELGKVNRHQPVRVLAKLEGQNPSGSVKDRLALYLVADAMERGVAPGDTLVEASSGNTGISLAMICAQLGFRLVVTVADNVSVERFKIMRAFGVEVVLTPGELGTCGAIEKARELGERPGHFWVAQHFNHVNSFAHYETTGVEIIEQVRGLQISDLDAFVASTGTTGTLMGISARLKERFPELEVVSVWPVDKIMGIRRPEGEGKPTIYDERRIDRVVEVRSAEAMAMVRQVSAAEGILCGVSGGAAVVGALTTAERLKRELGHGTVLVLLPDWGERYLSLREYEFGTPGGRT